MFPPGLVARTCTTLDGVVVVGVNIYGELPAWSQVAEATCISVLTCAIRQERSNLWSDRIAIELQEELPTVRVGVNRPLSMALLSWSVELSLQGGTIEGSVLTLACSNDSTFGQVNVVSCSHYTRDAVRGFRDGQFQGRSSA